MREIKRLKIKKETLHGIVWGSQGSGYGIDIDKKTTIWFFGTNNTNRFIYMEIVKNTTPTNKE